MAPIRFIARSAIIHSGLFSETITTLSPGLIPRDRKPPANSLTFKDVSFQVKGIHSLSFFAHKKGFSLYCSALSKKSLFKD